MDTPIRPANVAVLVKLETTEGVDASPAAAVDAIPVEADSVSYNSPWTNEDSNEATGSLVAGAPLIIGQAATISFKSRIKGAGSGTTYTSSVKPPLHQPLAACGWKPFFQAAIAAAVATAGTANSATLGTGYSTTARSYVGMMARIGAGVGSGAVAPIIEYTSGKVASLGDTFSPVLDTTSSIAIAANWTYAMSSPSDAASRATDQPSATIYIYEDGRLLKFIGCRGTMNLDGQNARPGYATFSFSGVYAGASDAAIPGGLVIAGHSAPVLVQGTQLSDVLLINRKPLAVNSWSLDGGSQLENPDDPNSTWGFGSPLITDRKPILKLDPLMTLIANRDTVTDIGNGTTMPGSLRFGNTGGNRWGLVLPQLQPISADPGTRGKLRTEEVQMQARSIGKDAQSRDLDAVIVFD